MSKPGLIPHLSTLFPSCSVFLIFISGVTPADLLLGRIAVRLFRTHVDLIDNVCAFIDGLASGIEYDAQYAL